jgi:small-conductance mechanosensitive channel
MMTLQLTPKFRFPRTIKSIGSRIARCVSFFLVALLIAEFVITTMEQHVAAQTYSYGPSYPVENSYPISNSYPVTHSYPASTHQVIGQPIIVSDGHSSIVNSHVGNPVITSPSNTIRRTVVPNSHHTSRVTTSQPQPIPIASTSSNVLSEARTDSRTGQSRKSQNQTVARLASTSSYRVRPRFPIESEQLPRAIEHTTRYTNSMIESARQSALQFRRIAQTAAPVTALVAEENAVFAEQWAELAKTHAELRMRVDDAVFKLDSTSQDLDDVNNKLSNYGLTPTIGLLLRNKKEQLDAWQVHDSQTDYTSEEIQRSRQKQLELEMVSYQGIDPAAETIEVLADAGLDAGSRENATLVTQVQHLLHQRGQWLNALHEGYQDYQTKLGELDSTTAASTQLTRDYRKLIDRHITWIRSGDPISFSDLGDLRGGIGALFDARRSGDFGPTVERKWRADSASGILLLGWILLVLVARWFAKSRLIGIGSKKRMKDATKNSRKLVAGILTVVVALAFPAILYAIARWLGNGIVSESTLHASAGFYAASIVALMVEVPRQLLRPFGYLEKHVDVILPGRERAAKYLTLVGLALVVAAYAVTVMGAIDHGAWRGSVARFGFLFAMLLVAWTAHRALRPTGGLLEPLIAKFGGSVIHRVRFLIYAVGIGFPIAMIALSALGYGFTANELIKRAIITLVSLMIGATLWGGIKIASAHAWQMLTGATPPPRQFDEYGEIKTTAVASDAGVLDEHFLELKHHLAFLCQTALVIGAIGTFGWLWIDIFPNAQMGNPVVWNVEDTVTLSSMDATGNTVTSSNVETTPITAFHLVLAAATLFVAFQLAKLLPALFDALVLQRVSFDEGMEHFSLVLGRFLLFSVGCFIACRWIGIRWHAIQWLAVGATVGLGFGLQDMVRNLFGGLVVLFEKPARLGDLITVGEATGRVAMQRLRTTTLSDDEGREVIIPNKNFVSEEVVNWMGAGRLNVVPIEVAVTRDQRPADLCRTLQELVIEQPDVLLTPAPQATLVCVGKRSQRIEVRAWIEEERDAHRFRDNLLKVVRRYLKENQLLTLDQPSQPAIQDAATRSYGKTG